MLKIMIILMLLQMAGHTIEDPWMPVSKQQQKRCFWTTKKFGGFQADSLVLASTGRFATALHPIFPDHPGSHCSTLCLRRLQGGHKKETEPKHAVAKHHKSGLFRIKFNPDWLGGCHKCWCWGAGTIAVHKLHFPIRGTNGGKFCTCGEKNSASTIKIPLGINFAIFCCPNSLRIQLRSFHK